MSNNIKSKIATYALALAPILSIYSFVAGLSIGYALLILALILNFNKSYYKNSIEYKFYIAVIILSVLGFLFNISNIWFNAVTWVNNILSLSVILLSLVMLIPSVNHNIFKRIVLFVGIAASIIVSYQYVFYKVSGIANFNMYIPGLELIIDKEEAINIYNYRPSAFFLEPSHLSIYLAPLVVLMLHEKKYVLCTIFTIGILASGSSSGMLFLMIGYAYWLFSSKQKTSTIVFVVIFGFSIMYYLQNLMTSNIDRLTNYDTNSTRLLGSLVYFNSFDTINWLFGVGLNQLSEMQRSLGNIQDYNVNYAAAIIYMTLSYGISGLIVLVSYLFHLIKLHRASMGVILIFIGVIFSDQILFNYNYLYLVSFILLFPRLINCDQK